MATFEWKATFQDEGGNTASTGGFIVATDAAEAQTKLQGVIEAISNPAPAGVGALPLTLGALVSVYLNLLVDFSSWTVRTVAASGSENQKGGRFLFRGAGLNSRAMMTIPTFNEALKDTDGNLLTANPAISAFVTGYTGAAGGADNRGDDLVAMSDAYYTYGGKSARR